MIHRSASKVRQVLSIPRDLEDLTRDPDLEACVVGFTYRLLHSIPDHLLQQSTIIQPLCRLLRYSSLLDGTDGAHFDASGREEPRVFTPEVRKAREENRVVLEERVLRLWAQLWTRIAES